MVGGERQEEEATRRPQCFWQSLRGSCQRVGAPVGSRDSWEFIGVRCTSISRASGGIPFAPQPPAQQPPPPLRRPFVYEDVKVKVHPVKMKKEFSYKTKVGVVFILFYEAPTAPSPTAPCVHNPGMFLWGSYNWIVSRRC